MALYCDTNELAAVCSGQKQMKRIDTDLIELVLDLEPEIKRMSGKRQGQILLIVQHGWVSAIDATVRKFRQKLKLVD